VALLSPACFILKFVFYKVLKHIRDEDIRFVEQTGQYLKLKYCILTQRQAIILELGIKPI
jgi:hypothetical protein